MDEGLTNKKEEDKMVKWQTKTGKEVTMQIVTERESIGDHTLMVPCYELKAEIQGIGSVGPLKLDGDVFRETATRTIGGKVVRLAFPACQEAKALYAEYSAEVARRIEANINAEMDYLKHHDSVLAAMAE